MRPAGLEPATCGLGNRRSIRTELRAQRTGTEGHMTPTKATSVSYDKHTAVIYSPDLYQLRCEFSHVVWPGQALEAEA